MLEQLGAVFRPVYGHLVDLAEDSARSILAVAAKILEPLLNRLVLKSNLCSLSVPVSRPLLPYMAKFLRNFLYQRVEPWVVLNHGLPACCGHVFLVVRVETLGLNLADKILGEDARLLEAL